VDEYGEMQGIITLNDFVDALVGDISDFYETAFTCMQREDGSWLIDGMFPYAEFILKFDKDGKLEKRNYNTVAGLIVFELKKVPKTGDVLLWNGMKLEVVDMDGPRIDKVLLSPNASDA
jgi:putative hemolysin